MTICDWPPFVFSDQDGMEKANRYGPGGLHPTKMGDILGPETSGGRQYQLFAKLGYGAYSTVWLARDLMTSKTVAVKIVAASETPMTREAAILERLHVPSESQPPRVLQIVDSFTVTSANGVHQVLVTELVLRLERFLKLIGTHGSIKNLVRQALEGLALIHDRGIAHGDLHPDNLGVAVELENFSEMRFLRWHGVPELVPLIPNDPTRNPAAFPPYISRPVDLGPFLVEHIVDFTTREPQLRILDLGSAYLASKNGPSPRCNTPVIYAAPEVIFPYVTLKNRDGPWDRQTDIWALASTIHELASGARLFSGGAGWPLLVNMAAICGGAPDEWVQYLATVPRAGPPQEYTMQRADALWAGNAAGFIEKGASKEDADGLVKLLRRMLVINPDKRPTALELLQDPYFAE
ncbi:kinase-like domain-containing protein [Mycena latifolia]|nr:kinase-like domain-containing protein [Mycena latifolia]